MKKLLSIILISMLIMSTVVSTAAYSTDESRLAVEDAVQVNENPDEVETNRYYFLMPDGTNGQKNPYENDAENYGKYVASWYNEYTDTPAIYFWNENSIFFPDDNSASNTSVIKGDSDCVFYADVPKSDTAIVWSNNVEYSGASDPMFAYARYTVSIPCEYYDAGESDIYPDGVDGFDNMIYVLHAPTSSTDRLPSSSNEFIGEWYYYYGNGCYGTVENGTVDNCIRDDHDHRSFGEQLKDYEELTGEKVETNRYYFLMPNGTNSEVCDNELYKNYGERPRSWYNENADHAGVYWWYKGLLAPKNWPGYKMNKSDAESVFYVDLPTYVDTVIFNNYFDSGTDSTDPIYFDGAQTIDVYLLGYDEGETDLYPEGLDTLENMIYVLEYNCDIELEPRNIWGGEWYYYYGDGCYGTVENGTVDHCIRDDHEHYCESECLYKEKFENYVHCPEYNSDIHTDTCETFYDYDELYYHKDSVSGETDWALITAKVDILLTWEKVEAIRIGSRVLRYWSSGAYILPYALVIYDASEDTFKCISEVDFADYAGLVEAVEQLKLGLAVGDVDMDGDVSILDATEIQRYLAKLKDLDIVLSGYITTLADVQVDGKMSIIDATAIQRKLAKLDVVDTGKFVFYKQDKNASFGDIPDVSGDVVRIEFTSEYELSQFSNIMYDYEVVGDYCTYAIIKSNEQYNMLFNDKAPKFDDEFFERKSLVVSIVLCSDLLTEAPITKLGIVDDTLFVSAFPYRTNPDLPAPEAMQMWLSIVSVDKELVADVSNIIYGRM